MGKSKKKWKKRVTASLLATSVRDSVTSVSVQGEVVGFFQEIVKEGALSALVSLHYFFARPEAVEAAKFRLRFKGKDIEVPSSDMESIRAHCKRHAVESRRFYVKEHSPQTFARIRGTTNIDFVASLDPAVNKRYLQKNTGNRGGKSNAFIFVTFDRKLVIKTLSKKERNLFVSKLLPLYEERIKSGGSLLAKSLGVFTIQTSTGFNQCILIMENVLASSEKISAIFDMKGSKLARKILKHDKEIPVEELPSYQTYKDLDFFQTQKMLRLSEADEKRLKDAVFADVELLRITKIMDYSLLLAVGRPQHDGNQHMFRGVGDDHDKAYYIGIIDYLELYSTKKQLEGVSKSILHTKVQRDDISSVDSETYANRFLQLIQRILPSRSSPST